MFFPHYETVEANKENTDKQGSNNKIEEGKRDKNFTYIKDLFNIESSSKRFI